MVIFKAEIDVVAKKPLKSVKLKGNFNIDEGTSGLRFVSVV